MSQRENIEYLQKARQWLAEDFDEVTQKQLQGYIDQNNTTEIADCFYTELDFGTAGMRGIVGPGPNRMNVVMVVKTASAMLAYLRESFGHDTPLKIVLGHDARLSSADFAQFCAEVFLADSKVTLYYFNQFAPTPLVAYALKKLEAHAAVVITASHNPPQYNGFKAYSQNGAQILSPVDKHIKQNIRSISSVSKISRASLKVNDGFHPQCQIIDDIAQQYFADIIAVKPASWPPVSSQAGDDFSLAYSAMHGVGGRFALEVFSKAGIKNVYTVGSQQQPDGNFPTVNFPNPEDEEALALLMALAKQKKVDVALANDPDADRLAVVAPVNFDKQVYRRLSGDEIGIILAKALLDAQHNKQDCLLINTVVSSGMMQKLAQKYGCHYEATLTGFKWIANKAIELSQGQLSQERKLKPILGYEEAIGYTVFDLVRDKDGISAAFLFALLSAKLKLEGKTIIDYLNEIFVELGLHVSWQKSLTLSGSEGLEKIQAIMQKAEDYNEINFAGYKIIKKISLKKQIVQDLKNSSTSPTNLPPTDGVIFLLENSLENSLENFHENFHRVIFRPSGTEPKLKIYFEVCLPVSGQDEIVTAKEQGMKIIEEIHEFCAKTFYS